MNQGIIEVHNPELCSEILDDRLLRLESELPSSSEDDNTNKTTNINASQHVPQRLPSRSSTSQAIHAVEWLSRKARRAVVVSHATMVMYTSTMLIINFDEGFARRS